MLYYILMLFNSILLLQSLSLGIQLPQECGKLDEKLLYNRKTVAASNEYPWLGILGYIHQNRLIKYDCIAVLISERHIIMPAHCLSTKESDAFSVVFGNWQIDNNIMVGDCELSECDQPPKIYYLEEISPHFQYNGLGFHNDIGLAKLKENVEFTDYIQPICLPPAGEQSDQYVGQRIEFVGYPFKNQTNKYRFKTHAHVPSFEYCKNESSLLGLTRNHMCAYLIGNIEPMSGSVLMGINVVNGKPTNFYLMGILSFGTVRSGSVYLDSPMFFLRISYFRDLILQNIK